MSYTFPSRQARKRILQLAIVCACSFTCGQPTIATADADDSHPVELAPLMGELQRLTHKLSLSIAHSNYRLAEFYLHECLEALEEIKEEGPQYEGFSVALLIDQISTPKYENLKKALAGDPKTVDKESLKTTFADLIDSCNECHQATQHGFIKITDFSSSNPFNQDFSPDL